MTMDSAADRPVVAIGLETSRSRGALDRDERLVKDGILRMGSLVETQIRNAIRSLVDDDFSSARASDVEPAQV